MLPRGYIEQPRPKPETARQLNGLGTLPLRWILAHQETNHGPQAIHIATSEPP